jgi:hypothetical protein
VRGGPHVKEINASVLEETLMGMNL